MTTTSLENAGQFDDHLDALDALLKAEGVEAGAADQIPLRPAGAPTPMSFSQELLWLLDRATPGMTAYNMPIARRLKGALHVDALEAALTAVARRHESLRTRFADVDGDLRQVVVDAAPVALRVVDVSASPDPVQDASRAVRELARVPFDLLRDTLFRAALVRIAADDHVLLIDTHHIVVDGWSIGIVLNELATEYAAAHAGRASELPMPEIQYGDFAAWQRARLSGAHLDELLGFWRAQLGEAADPLEVPTDFRRSTAPNFAGARASVVLDAATTKAIKKFAGDEGITLYMLLLGAYATVLHRYSGKQNVLIGSGSAGRTMPETEHLVGYVNNTLVQRANFTGDPTIRELLDRVRQSALGAYDHQDIPLEKLVLELRKDDATHSHAPLFEVVLTMQDTVAEKFQMVGLTVEPFGADMAATKFDITLFAGERAGELHITSQYRSELFAPATMRRFLGHLRRVLETAVANPALRVSEIQLLTDTERTDLATWNDTRAEEGASATLVDAFEAQAARVPQRAAVVAPGAGANVATLTYAELNARANQLGHHLRALGVTRESPVGLLLDGSADALVALIGIIKAGGAYVPLSIDAPASRIVQQLDECGASVIVTSASLADRLPSRVKAVLMDGEADIRAMQSQPSTNLAASTGAEDLAYVLFTSGSTGVPKGVAVTHSNAVHYARAVSRVLAATPHATSGDGFAAADGWQFGLASTLAADLGNTSLLVSLMAGGTLHILGKQVTTEPERFAQYVQANRLDLLKITPSHLMALAAGKTGAELAALLPRQWLVTGGEALRLDVARTILATGACRLLNHYGPTETTVGACTFEVTEQSLADVEAVGAQTVPIGRALANTRTYVVDARGNEQPLAIPGELWIGGDGVTRGYYKRDDLTHDRFTEYRGDRVYHTGDRVRRLENGAVEFLGRADDQVKIRGYRVELGDVAHALRTNPGVQDAVAVLRTDAQADAQLVAYVVAKQAGYAVSHSDRPSVEKLTEWMAGQLPEYMVPSAIVMLDGIPLTANGKVDTKALPAPDASASPASQFVEPRTATEKELAAIWADVLKKDRVGLSDNFIALGGHSLMAIRVLGKISKSFGVRLTLRALFDAPTVEQLAAALDAEKSKAAPAASAGIGAMSRDAHRIGRPAAKPGGTDGSGTTG